MPRVDEHPVLGPRSPGRQVAFTLDGEAMRGEEGEPIAAALWAAGVRALRHSPRLGGPRGVFCAIGRCTDCVMTVDGQPNVRTCVTALREGMQIETQRPEPVDDEG